MMLNKVEVREYTVVLLWPANDDNGNPSTYVTSVTAPFATDAVNLAQGEAVKASGGEFCHDDFYPLFVTLGDCDNLLD